MVWSQRNDGCCSSSLIVNPYPQSAENTKAPEQSGAFVHYRYGLWRVVRQVGRTKLLQIYDSDRYTELPVDILRREKIILPGLRQVDTLVIQPKLTTEGIFRRTGDVLIWLTDDQHRVPVKFVTSIALGQVTAELVSSDVQQPAAAEAGK